MRNRIRLFLLFMCLGLAGSWNDVFGQIPSEVSEARSEGAVRFRVHVDLTTVQVMAFDKKGEPVSNLAKEDFQLFEDGERREILSLDEVNAQPANSALGINLTDESALSRGKTVLIVFDDTAIRSEYIQTARKSAADFIRRNMRSQDVFAVAAFGMTMQILQNFTGDKEAVLEAVESPAGANAGGGPIYFENLLREFAGIIPSLGRIRGQKTVLVYARMRFPQRSFSIAGIVLDWNRNVIGKAVDADLQVGHPGEYLQKLVGSGEKSQCCIYRGSRGLNRRIRPWDFSAVPGHGKRRLLHSGYECPRRRAGRAGSTDQQITSLDINQARREEGGYHKVSVGRS